MQQKHRGKMMRYLVMALVLCCSLALFACSSGEDEVVRDVNSTVAVDQNTVAAITNQPFSFPSGAAFSPALANTPITLRFPTPTTFALTAGGATATGNVTISSANFVILATGGIQGLTANQPIFFPTFNISINATGAQVGGDGVNGQVSIVLIRPGFSLTSAPITSTIAINANGQLIIDGVTTTINTTPTGATGTGGQ
ncbi:MAG: hypothetical protein FJZ47_00830 [Candidatus Tectomicrobia bacterium]|uniref:DUF5666 domain-containing protein n=1 Tax=Tectimicrobiota bacterium TaxID=2528274 RepID=A0A937VZ10_UNCTE|nr:hypothetical protein [Candidatus Tectomicrobia bacterium]